MAISYCWRRTKRPYKQEKVRRGAVDSGQRLGAVQAGRQTDWPPEDPEEPDAGLDLMTLISSDSMFSITAKVLTTSTEVIEGYRSIVLQ